MTIRIKGDSISINASAVEATVVEFSPPEGVEWHFLEITLQATGAGYYRIYINNEKICDKIDKDAAAIDARRILVDWSLKVGDVLKIVFTDTSGAANTARYLVVYSEITP